MPGLAFPPRARLGASGRTRTALFFAGAAAAGVAAIMLLADERESEPVEKGPGICPPGAEVCIQ